MLQGHLTDDVTFGLASWQHFIVEQFAIVRDPVLVGHLEDDLLDVQ